MAWNFRKFVFKDIFMTRRFELVADFLQKLGVSMSTIALITQLSIAWYYAKYVLLHSDQIIAVKQYVNLVCYELQVRFQVKTTVRNRRCGVHWQPMHEFSISDGGQPQLRCGSLNFGHLRAPNAPSLPILCRAQRGFYKSKILSPNRTPHGPMFSPYCLLNLKQSWHCCILPNQTVAIVTWDGYEKLML